MNSSHGNWRAFLLHPSVVLVVTLAAAACGGGGAGNSGSGSTSGGGSSQNIGPASDYTVGQFNMAGGDQARTGVLTGTEAPDALLERVRTHRPVFVTIQEACQDWSEYMDGQLADYAVAFNAVVGAGGQTAQCRHNPKSNFGNAVLYRNDLGIDAAPVAHSLGSPAGMEQREMLCVRSTVRSIVVCSIHLSDADANVRYSEAAQARQILASEYAGYTKFVGGDLHDTPLSAAADNFYHSDYGDGAVGEFKEVDSPCGNKMAGSLNTVSYDPVTAASVPVVISCRDGEPTVGDSITGRKVDFLFVSPTVSVRDADAIPATYSDHALLLAGITVGVSDPGPVDSTPPTTVAVTTPPAVGGWNFDSVTVNFGAIDEVGGSGVKSIHVVLRGVEKDTITIPGSNGSVTIDKKGTTHVTYFASDNAGNHEDARTLTLRIKSPVDDDDDDDKDKDDDKDED